MKTLNKTLADFLSNNNNLCGMSRELAAQTIRVAGGADLFLVGTRRPTAFEQHRETLFKASSDGVVNYLNNNKSDLLKLLSDKASGQFDGSVVAYTQHHINKQKSVSMKCVADGLYNNLTLSEIISSDDFSLEDRVVVVSDFVYGLAVKHVFDCYITYLDTQDNPGDFNDHPFGVGSSLYDKDRLLDDVVDRMGGGYGIGLLSKQCLNIKCKDICLSFKNANEVVTFFELHKADIVDVIKTVGAKDGIDSAVETIQKYAEELGCSDEDIGRGIYGKVDDKTKPERLKVKVAKAAVNLVFMAAAEDYISHQESKQL